MSHDGDDDQLKYEGTPFSEVKLHDHFTSNKWDGLPSFVPYIRFNRGNKFLFYGYIMWTIIQFCDGFHPAFLPRLQCEATVPWCHLRCDGL